MNQTSTRVSLAARLAYGGDLVEIVDHRRGSSVVLRSVRTGAFSTVPLARLVAAARSSDLLKDQQTSVWAQLEIKIQARRPHRPSDKSIIERQLRRLSQEVP